MKFLLDTCVISEFVRKTPSDKLKYWLASKNEQNLFISVLTIGEIQQGISKLEDSNKKLSLQNWLDNDIEIRFSERIISIDVEVIDRWGRLRGESVRKGRNLAVVDSLLAATAISHGMTLVTRNVPDFVDTGVTIRNPWE